MIGDRDAGVFFNPRDFAHLAQFHPAETPAASHGLPGIFNAAHVVALRGVETLAAVLTIAAAGITPRRPERGDRLTIDGDAWRVAEVQPDGSGLVRLILERV